MPNYIRAFQPGGTFFFTVVTEEREHLFRSPNARLILRDAISLTRQRWSFEILAMVLLPDHVHTIWTLPAGDHDFSRRWSFLKRTFTKSWLAQGGSERDRSASRRRNRRRGVWQRRFWERTLRDSDELYEYYDYIHFNPVRHGLASCPHAWPFSTFRRFVRDGWYTSDWRCVCSAGPVGESA